MAHTIVDILHEINILNCPKNLLDDKFAEYLQIKASYVRTNLRLGCCNNEFDIFLLKVAGRPTFTVADIRFIKIQM